MIELMECTFTTQCEGLILLLLNSSLLTHLNNFLVRQEIAIVVALKKLAQLLAHNGQDLIVTRDHEDRIFSIDRHEEERRALLPTTDHQENHQVLETRLSTPEGHLDEFLALLDEGRGSSQNVSVTVVHFEIHLTYTVRGFNGLILLESSPGGCPVRH